MIEHIDMSRVELVPVGNDDEYAGDHDSRLAEVFTSADGTVVVGVWSFSGEVRAAPQDGYEEVVVVTAGSAEVTCEGGTYRVEAGDAVIYDGPIGDKWVRSEGFRAVYVVRYRP